MYPIKPTKLLAFMKVFYLINSEILSIWWISWTDKIINMRNEAKYSRMRAAVYI